MWVGTSNVSCTSDSGIQANVTTAALWDTSDPWGTSSDSGTKEPASTSGWGDTDTWGGNSGTTDPSAGGWGNASGGDKSVDTWGTAGTSDMTVCAQEKPGHSEPMESSAGRRGGASGSGWDNPSTGAWGASGTTEMTSFAQSKRNDANQENHTVKPSPVPPPPRPPRRDSRAQDDEEDVRPLKMTGTNNVPMVNTRWKKMDTAASPQVEPSERPRVPPLQTSALNNATPREPPTPMSAGRSEDGRMNVENWRRDTIPEKVRDMSPSLSTAAGSTINRKRKRGGSDLERKQDIWRDFIRCVKSNIQHQGFR